MVSVNDQMPVPPPITGNMPARTAASMLSAAPCPYNTPYRSTIPSGTPPGTVSSTCRIAACVCRADAGGSGLRGSSSVLTSVPAYSLVKPVKLCAMSRRVPASRAASSR
jgi:hypothetical protein